VQPFPAGSAGKWKIGDGVQPRWRRNGKELFYVSSDSRMMAVDVSTNPVFWVGTPKILFPAAIQHGGRDNMVMNYDVAADGSKFLVNAMSANAGAGSASSITVVVN
jgi:hypothetical protein